MTNSELHTLAVQLLQNHIKEVYDKIVDTYPDLSLEETLQVARKIAHYEMSINQEIFDDYGIND